MLPEFWLHNFVFMYVTLKVISGPRSRISLYVRIIALLGCECVVLWETEEDFEKVLSPPQDDCTVGVIVTPSAVWHWIAERRALRGSRFRGNDGPESRRLKL